MVKLGIDETTEQGQADPKQQRHGEGRGQGKPSVKPIRKGGELQSPRPGTRHNCTMVLWIDMPAKPLHDRRPDEGEKERSPYQPERRS
jgi:hypothetical protein